MNKIFHQSVFWYGQGVSVIPVRAKEKAAAVSWKEYQHRLSTPSELFRWFSNGRYSNYGVLCGKRHGKSGYLTVLDFDDLQAYLDFFNTEWSYTYSVLSSRGAHAYFYTQQESLTMGFDKLDIKGNGYILGCDSVHPTGTVYQLIYNYPVMEVNSIEDVIPSCFLEDFYRKKSEQKAYPAITSMPVPLKYEPQAACMSLDEQLNRPITPTLVRDIKQNFSILSLFPDARKSGENMYLARCPFHDDKSPSLWISEKTGHCNCYKCQFPRNLDIIDLYAKLNNLNNNQAIKRLQALLIN